MGWTKLDQELFNILNLYELGDEHTGGGNRISRKRPRNPTERSAWEHDIGYDQAIKKRKYNPYTTWNPADQRYLENAASHPAGRSFFTLKRYFAGEAGFQPNKRTKYGHPTKGTRNLRKATEINRKRKALRDLRGKQKARRIADLPSNNPNLYLDNSIRIHNQQPFNTTHSKTRWLFNQGKKNTRKYRSSWFANIQRAGRKGFVAGGREATTYTVDSRDWKKLP